MTTPTLGLDMDLEPGPKGPLKEEEDMLERVAWAIYVDLCKDTYVGMYQERTRTCAGTVLDGGFDLLAVARAAIKAMRVPTDAMCEAVPHDGSRYSCWIAMIDAALQASEGGGSP